VIKYESTPRRCEKWSLKTVYDEEVTEELKDKVKSKKRAKR